MAVHTVTLITGDGTGPELAAAAKKCVGAALAKTDGAASIEWVECVAGVDIMDEYGTPMPEATIESVRTTDATLKAPITTPIGGGFRSVNVLLRQTLDMYCCLRPCKSYPGVRSRYEDIDLVLVRENCEDLYAGVEFPKGSPEVAELIETVNRLSTDKKVKTPPETTGVSIKPISEQNSERIVRFAFEYARKHGRKKVTYVEKANIMKHSDGLFKAVAEQVAKDYPDIESEERLIDNMCMQLVQKPELYDVIVTENLSAPKYKGQNKVNPSALILSGKLMLEYLGEDAAAATLEAALAKVIAAGDNVTYDMKPHRDDPTAVGTREMADAIIDAM